MDLLIELIVWLFKALSGTDEKSKKQGGAGQPPPPQRGPYNYGDGRPAAPGIASRSRTLEEILEEVKRQQQSARKKSAVPRQAPNASPQMMTPPVQRRKPEPPPPPLEPEAEYVPAVGLDHVLDRHMTSNLDKRFLNTESMEQKEIVRPGEIEKKFDQLKSREETRFRPLSEQSPTGDDARTASKDISGVAIQAESAQKSWADFFRTMRSATPQTRVEMARRAFVFSEVFGPPRCKRLMQRQAGRN